MARSDKEVLEELVNRFDYGTAEWKDIRDEAIKDMLCAGGDCWDPADRKAREELGRPVLEVDELSQYLNQGINDLRQNKRGIKVTAKGNGATDQTARFRQGKIRDIEYNSNAQQAYLTMAENVFQRSYGFFRIVPKFISDESFDQELLIEPVVNPDNVTPDPDHQRPDGSDLEWLFYHEDWMIRDFKAKYPKARVKDFSLVSMKSAPKWLRGHDRIRVAEYWTKERKESRRLLKLKPAGTDPNPLDVYEDEYLKLSGGKKVPGHLILKSREVEQFEVVKYITNGVEILERVPWLGPSIPWVTCYGKVLYIDEGQGAKKQILSMIRLARSPQMLYAYYRTQQAEMAGMIPKTPVTVVKGQLDGVANNWARAAHEPVAFLEYNWTVEGLPPGVVLPPPQRLEYSAGEHLQALELCAEGARRAIQAAMGISPLPTAAQRRGEKSGVALKEMKDSEQVGSFHFVDHYDESVQRGGAILSESMKFYYDTARETTIRTPDDKAEQVRINDEEAIDPKTNQKRHIDIGAGDHDVTISVGPAQASEREASSDFADSILSSKEIMMVAGPQRAAKLVAAAVRLKNVGPIGDQIADLFDPKDDADPAMLQQQAGELKQALEQCQQQLQQLMEEVKSDRYKVDAQKEMKLAELGFKKWQVERDGEIKITVAELTAKVERLALFLEERARITGEAHEVGLTAMEHEHAKELAQQAAVSQGALAAQGHGQALEAGAQGHEHALEQGTAASDAVLAQQAQAADLAPQPQAGA